MSWKFSSFAAAVSAQTSNNESVLNRMEAEKRTSAMIKAMLGRELSKDSEEIK